MTPEFFDIVGRVASAPCLADSAGVQIQGFHHVSLEIVTEPARIDTPRFEIVVRTGTFSGIASHGPLSIRARARSIVTAPNGVEIVA